MPQTVEDPQQPARTAASGAHARQTTTTPTSLSQSLVQAATDGRRASIRAAATGLGLAIVAAAVETRQSIVKAEAHLVAPSLR